MDAQIINAVSEGEIEVSILDIQKNGFRTCAATRQIGTGLLAGTATEEYVYVAVATCGDHVRALQQLGPACKLCVLDKQRDPAYASLTRAQLEWLSKPCRHHYHRCVYPFCRQAACRMHMEKAPDRPGFYCEEHFIQVSEELVLEDLKEEKGPVGAFLNREIRSWFMFEKDTHEIRRDKSIAELNKRIRQTSRRRE